MTTKQITTKQGAHSVSVYEGDTYIGCIESDGTIHPCLRNAAGRTNTKMHTRRAALLNGLVATVTL